MADQEQFDPYRKWLGIPASELPPTHYRLLGLVEFESDPDVISNAADRCMAHVRTYQTGAHAALSQKILNELSLAQSCLLNPQARAQYDQQLRARRVTAPPAVTGAPLASPMAPVSVSGTPAPPAGAMPPVATPVSTSTGLMDGPDLTSVGKPSGVVRRPKKKSSPLPILVTLALLMLAVVIVVVMMGDQIISTPTGKTAKPNTNPQKPRTIVIKRQKPGNNVSDRVLNPLDDSEQRSGGAKILEIQPSTEIDYRGSREEPTSAAEAIELARMAMARANPFRAKRLLEAAEQLSPNAEQLATIENLTKVFDYLNTFYRAFMAGMADLEPGQKLLIESGNEQYPVTFQEFESQNGRRLVFEVNGQQRSYRLDELPADWALSIARTHLDAKSPASRLATATFLAIATNGDRTLAKQMWESLIADGIAEPDLVRELKIEVSKDIAKKSTPAPEMKPEQPSESKPKQTGQNKNLPIPTGDDLLEANRKFRDQYRDQVSKARSASEKGALAQEVFSQAEASKEDAALRYVMQSNAIDLAVGQGVPAEFLKLIDAHSDAYAVDRLKLKADALQAAEKDAASEEQGNALYLATAEVYVTAKEMRHYEAAAQLAKTAVKCAQRAQDRDAARFAEGEARRMQSLYQLQSDGMAGQRTLKESPEDSAALADVGRMECFLNENWEAGLPMLSQGDDSTLAELAKSDLASPPDTSAKAELAKSWLNYANTQREGGKQGPLLRAKYWYNSALESAEASAQAELKSSLQEVESQIKNEG